ncbi:hypothetical protein BESB_022690 [Besnoitia besnoiti]|uniref:Uncharacterized protein n=1 Tax=Besnoitia besnoiti TaxID=94643 RepID=A0A2A9M7Z8_BESBE|nr:hypothetical protein BESB_022690 [Besnoitia besnoiti]PFH31777.1 hypothetical protein BESB_022690 [Besnoitia besnoiti]
MTVAGGEVDSCKPRVPHRLDGATGNVYEDKSVGDGGETTMLPLQRVTDRDSAAASEVCDTRLNAAAGAAASAETSSPPDGKLNRDDDLCWAAREARAQTAPVFSSVSANRPTLDPLVKPEDHDQVPPMALWKGSLPSAKIAQGFAHSPPTPRTPTLGGGAAAASHGLAECKAGDDPFRGSCGAGPAAALAADAAEKQNNGGKAAVAALDPQMDVQCAEARADEAELIEVQKAISESEKGVFSACELKDSASCISTLEGGSSRRVDEGRAKTVVAERLQLPSHDEARNLGKLGKELGLEGGDTTRASETTVERDGAIALRRDILKACSVHDEEPPGEVFCQASSMPLSAPLYVSIASAISNLKKLSTVPKPPPLVRDFVRHVFRAQLDQENQLLLQVFVDALPRLETELQQTDTAAPGSEAGVWGLPAASTNKTKSLSLQRVHGDKEYGGRRTCKDVSCTTETCRACGIQSLAMFKEREKAGHLALQLKHYMLSIVSHIQQRAEDGALSFHSPGAAPTTDPTADSLAKQSPSAIFGFHKRQLYGAEISLVSADHLMKMDDMGDSGTSAKAAAAVHHAEGVGGRRDEGFVSVESKATLSGADVALSAQGKGSDSQESLLGSTSDAEAAALVELTSQEEVDTKLPSTGVPSGSEEPKLLVGWLLGAEEEVLRGLPACMVNYLLVLTDMLVLLCIDPAVLAATAAAHVGKLLVKDESCGLDAACSTADACGTTEAAKRQCGLNTEGGGQCADAERESNATAGDEATGRVPSQPTPNGTLPDATVLLASAEYEGKATMIRAANAVLSVALELATQSAYRNLGELWQLCSEEARAPPSGDCDGHLLLLERAHGGYRCQASEAERQGDAVAASKEFARRLAEQLAAGGRRASGSEGCDAALRTGDKALLAESRSPDGATEAQQNASMDGEPILFLAPLYTSMLPSYLTSGGRLEEDATAKPSNWLSERAGEEELHGGSAQAAHLDRFSFSSSKTGSQDWHRDSPGDLSSSCVEDCSRRQAAELGGRRYGVAEHGGAGVGDSEFAVPFSRGKVTFGTGESAGSRHGSGQADDDLVGRRGAAREEVARGGARGGDVGEAGGLADADASAWLAAGSWRRGEIRHGSSARRTWSQPCVHSADGCEDCNAVREGGDDGQERRLGDADPRRGLTYQTAASYRAPGTSEGISGRAAHRSPTRFGDGAGAGALRSGLVMGDRGASPLSPHSLLSTGGFGEPVSSCVDLADSSNSNSRIPGLGSRYPCSQAATRRGLGTLRSKDALGHQQAGGFKTIPGDARTSQRANGGQTPREHHGSVVAVHSTAGKKVLTPTAHCRTQSGTGVSPGSRQLAKTEGGGSKGGAVPQDHGESDTFHDTRRPMRGVYFDKTQRSWIGSFYEDRRQIKKRFKIDTYGFYEARALAVGVRMTYERRIRSNADTPSGSSPGPGTDSPACVARTPTASLSTQLEDDARAFDDTRSCVNRSKKGVQGSGLPRRADGELKKEEKRNCIAASPDGAIWHGQSGHTLHESEDRLGGLGADRRTTAELLRARAPWVEGGKDCSRKDEDDGESVWRMRGGDVCEQSAGAAGNARERFSPYPGDRKRDRDEDDEGGRAAQARRRQDNATAQGSFTSLRTSYKAEELLAAFGGAPKNEAHSSGRVDREPRHALGQQESARARHQAGIADGAASGYTASELRQGNETAHGELSGWLDVEMDLGDHYVRTPAGRAFSYLSEADSVDITRSALGGSGLRDGVHGVGMRADAVHAQYDQHWRRVNGDEAWHGVGAARGPEDVAGQDGEYSAADIRRSRGAALTDEPSFGFDVYNSRESKSGESEAHRRGGGDLETLMGSAQDEALNGGDSLGSLPAGGDEPRGAVSN